MPDDAPAPIPDPSDRSRRRRKKPTEPEPLPSTVAGRKREDVLGGMMASMLHRSAQIRANRRRAPEVDSTDYERAYDDIVNPIPRPRRLNAVADLSNFVGGAFLGYAINVLTNDRPDYTRFGLAGLAGVFLGGVAVALKNLKHAG